jgi:hypothetical protein
VNSQDKASITLPKDVIESLVGNLDSLIANASIPGLPPGVTPKVDSISVEVSLSSKISCDAFGKISTPTITDKEVELAWGNTQTMRMDAIKQLLVTDGVISNNIVEIGCGEMDYAHKLAVKLDKDCNWYAFDKEDFSNNAKGINKRFKEERVFFSTEIDYSRIKDSACLVVEVIEHMEYDEACDLILKVVNHEPDHVIITTPNYLFNKYYSIDGFRHSDHKFELDAKQFSDFISLVLSRSDTKYKAYNFVIGDKIDGEYVTNCCVLRKDI